MKKIIILIGSFIFVESAFAQNNYTIYGIVNKQYEGASVDFHNNSYNTGGYQFTTVKEGHFVIKGITKNIYDHCLLSLKKDGKTNYFNFFVGKGNYTIKVKKLNTNNLQNDVEYIHFPWIKEQEEYNSLITPYSIRSNEEYILLKNSEKNKLGPQVTDSLETVIKNLKKRSALESIEFIRKHINSYLAFYYFKEDVIPRNVHPDTLENIFSLFKKTFTNSEEGKIISQIIKSKKSITLGNILPDFKFITPDSIGYKLSGFQNKKFVLLCFWASWCGPCIKGFPIFRNIYDSFSNKGLQLISISFDDEIEHWNSSRKKYNLPWLQTNYLKEFMPNGNIKELYDIRYIPQYFLIDKLGRIIYHSEQNADDGSYTILKSLLSKIFTE